MSLSHRRHPRIVQVDLVCWMITMHFHTFGNLYSVCLPLSVCLSFSLCACVFLRSIWSVANTGADGGSDCEVTWTKARLNITFLVTLHPPSPAHTHTLCFIYKQACDVQTGRTGKDVESQPIKTSAIFNQSQPRTDRAITGPWQSQQQDKITLRDPTAPARCRMYALDGLFVFLLIFSPPPPPTPPRGKSRGGVSALG